MQRHTKAYLKHMGFDGVSWIPCEVNCGRGVVDVHHVHGRIGKNYDDPNGLVGLCRSCHTAVHSGAISKDFLLGIIQKRGKK